MKMPTTNPAAAHTATSPSTTSKSGRGFQDVQNSSVARASPRPASSGGNSTPGQSPTTLSPMGGATNSDMRKARQLSGGMHLQDQSPYRAPGGYIPRPVAHASSPSNNFGQRAEDQRPGSATRPSFTASETGLQSTHASRGGYFSQTGAAMRRNNAGGNDGVGHGSGRGTKTEGFVNSAIKKESGQAPHGGGNRRGGQSSRASSSTRGGDHQGGHS